jgi:hypothetical protein
VMLNTAAAKFKQPAHSSLMVALPPPNGIIDLPDQPGDPPSSDDFLSACAYRLDMAAAHSMF